MKITCKKCRNSFLAEGQPSKQIEYHQGVRNVFTLQRGRKVECPYCGEVAFQSGSPQEPTQPPSDPPGKVAEPVKSQSGESSHPNLFREPTEEIVPEGVVIETPEPELDLIETSQKVAIAKIELTTSAELEEAQAIIEEMDEAIEFLEPKPIATVTTESSKTSSTETNEALGKFEDSKKQSTISDLITVSVCVVASLWAFERARASLAPVEAPVKQVQVTESKAEVAEEPVGTEQAELVASLQDTASDHLHYHEPGELLAHDHADHHDDKKPLEDPEAIGLEQVEEVPPKFVGIEEGALAQKEIAQLFHSQSYLSSKFGYRVDPFNGRWAFHSGVDVAMPKGAKVNALLPGRVTFAGYKRGYGKMVIIDHPGGIQISYAHHHSIVVKEGDWVEAGSQIAIAGKTGRSTGTHVHYEVRTHGRRVDPSKIKPFSDLPKRKPRLSRKKRLLKA